jgi:hypothetical protein
MKGFSPTWCKWIASFMEGGHVGIKINDQIAPNFQTILFNIVVDMLAILIKITKQGANIRGDP